MNSTVWVSLETRCCGYCLLVLAFVATIHTPNATTENERHRPVRPMSWREKMDNIGLYILLIQQVPCHRTVLYPPCRRYAGMRWRFVSSLDPRPSLSKLFSRRPWRSTKCLGALPATEYLRDEENLRHSDLSPTLSSRCPRPGY